MKDPYTYTQNHRVESRVRMNENTEEAMSQRVINSQYYHRAGTYSHTRNKNKIDE